MSWVVFVSFFAYCCIFLQKFEWYLWRWDVQTTTSEGRASAILKIVIFQIKADKAWLVNWHFENASFLSLFENIITEKGFWIANPAWLWDFLEKRLRAVWFWNAWMKIRNNKCLSDLKAEENPRISNHGTLQAPCTPSPPSLVYNSQFAAIPRYSVC